MTQQQRYKEGLSWRRLVFDLVLSKNVPRLPTRQSSGQQNIRYCSQLFPQLGSKESTLVFIEECEAHIAQQQTKRLLDSYTQSEREAIFEELSQEFVMQQQPIPLSREHLLAPNATFMYKAEALMILSIRLSFAGWRHTMPVLKRAAEKFKNDEILLFNSSNLSRMMSGVITLLEKIDQMIITQSREAQLANQAQIENGDYTPPLTQSLIPQNDWSMSMLKLVTGPEYGSRRQIYLENSRQDRHEESIESKSSPGPMPRKSSLQEWHEQIGKVTEGCLIEKPF
ncbi:hypothetical protein METBISCDRAFT_21980 [Metschnikowia bicuspidata]|uniref:Uncharacterized protein n=1 Tax=Metschnikowia bicuspidata TaxID=27322 RepID=A0A4P9ZHT9_9ASCO|nr:hypothetical protein METBISCDRAFT_21980 [Metschnikowia bicuspidata]